MGLEPTDRSATIDLQRQQPRGFATSLAAKAGLNHIAKVLPCCRLGQALAVLVLNKWFEIEQIVGELRIRLGERATN